MLAVATNPAPPPLPTGEALATLSHELREPLAAIVLGLELHSGEGDPGRTASPHDGGPPSSASGAARR